MLKFTYYNTEKINDLKDFFTASFVLIDNVYNEIIPNSIKNRRNIAESKLSDSEVITISLILILKKLGFISLKRIFEIYFLIFVIEQYSIRLKEIYTK